MPRLPASTKELRVTITPGTIATALLIGAGAWLLIYLWDLLVIVLTAIVIASSVEPATKRLHSMGLPRVGGVLLVYGLLISALVVLFYFFVPPLLKETNSFITAVPEYLDTLTVISPDAPQNGLQSVETPQMVALRETLNELRHSLGFEGGGIAHAVSSIFGGVASFVLILVLSFYFAVREEGIDDFLRLTTPERHQPYVLDLWRRSQEKIGRWMQGQLLLSLIVGVLVYIFLAIFDVRYALLLGILAGVLELIPVFGSIIAAIPAVAIGVMDGGTPLALIIIGIYILVNQLEGNVIYPLVVQKVVGVPPLLVILALLAGAKVAGFLGILLSVPIAAAIQEFVSDYHRKKTEGLKELPTRD